MFPNALINYTVDDNNIFALSYNRRIRRPSFWNLNPYKSLLTAYSYYEGNPFLQPEYSNNFQLQHSWKNKLTSALYVIFTKDGFDDVTFADVDTNFVLRTPKNFVNSTRIGLSETYQLSPFHWWESNDGISVYYTNGRSLLSNIESRKGWGAYAFSNNNFYFDRQRTFSASVNFWYHFPEVSLVNKYDAYYNLDLGVNATLIKNKLLLNATLNDVFGTSAATYTTVVNNIRQKYSTLQLNRQFNLTMVFKFGKNKIQKVEHVGGVEDSKGRM